MKRFHLASLASPSFAALSRPLDPIYVGLGAIVEFGYRIVPSYPAVIIIAAVTLHIALLPLSLRIVRSQAALAKLQPQLDELRGRHRGDPQQLAAETQALFQSHGISPLAGCLPSLLQFPALAAMYGLIRGLIHRPSGAATFRPLHLRRSSRLYHALSAGTTMRARGIDLAQSGYVALRTSPWSAAVVIVLIAVTVGAGLVQQHLTRTRLPTSTQQRRLGKLSAVSPVVTLPWTLVLPVAVTLYWATSALLRLGQQWAFTRPGRMG